MLDFLLSMSSDAILVFDRDGRILRANQQAADMFGCSLEQLTKQKISKLVSRRYYVQHQKYIDAFLLGTETVYKVGKSRMTYARHGHKGEFPVELTLGKAELDGRTVLVACLRDASIQEETDEFIRSLANLPVENPNPVYRIQPTGEILFANASARQMLATLEPGAMNQAPAEVMEYVHKAIQEGTDIITMIPIRDRVFSFIINPVKDKGYINLSALDVTRREAERDKLALSEQILNSIGNLVLVANSHAEVVYVSPSVSNILGYEPNEILGNGWWEVERVSGGDVEMEKEYIRWAAAGLSTTDSKPYEHRIRHKDGTWRWLMLADTKGPKDLLIGIGTDITQLKQSEDALYTSEARYRLAIDAMNAVSYNLDYVEDRFTFLGEGIERITGYTPAELTPQKWSELLLEAHMGGKYQGLSLADAVQRVRTGDGDGVWRCDFKIEKKHGGACWISDTSVQILDKQGRVVGSVGIFQDITVRKQLEMQLRMSADEIQASNIALAEARDRALEAAYVKSAFLATMSHEIRTPMNAILGMSELLLETSLNEEQLEFAHVIESSTQNLLAVLNDILDFSKIEAGKLAIRPASFTPQTLVNETAKLFSMKASEKDIFFSVTIAENIPETLVGDAGRIQQILNNLVSNAIKFTPKDGFILVSLSGSQIEDTMVVTFTVRDTGEGIPDEVKPKLFEPFTQADISHARKHGGTGLGLAISKRLVDLMHGEIGFNSGEGQGTSFWFSLPLPRMKATQVNDQPNLIEVSKPPVSFVNEKPILIVEDNMINRDLLTFQLRELGLASRCATNGQEAVELLEVQPDEFSLVLMDLNMPVMDGFTATQRIREKENETQRHIPIIAVTANVMPEVREACMQLGVDDYLSKPVTLQNLITILETWLIYKNQSTKMAKL